MTIWLDFETYFADDFTLRSMTTEAYVRDSRFEVSCLAAFDDEDGAWSFADGPDEVDALLRGWRNWLPAQEVAAWNCRFDGFILSERYGLHPARWRDPMLEARYVLGTEASVSLAAVAALMRLPEKSVPYNDIKGCRWDGLPPPVRRALGEGCRHDVELMRAIAERLAPHVPEPERDMIDMTTRLYTCPQIRLDSGRLRGVIETEVASRAAAVERVGAIEDDLRSRDKFAALLESLGVEVEMKPGKKGPIPAVAKTDAFMMSLLDGVEGEEIQDLAEARLACASTIYRTRAQRFLDLSTRGPAPVAVGFRGAHPGRWVGEEGLNWQNVPKRGAMRTAIRPPPGHVFVHADLSQIELVVNAWMAGEQWVLDTYAVGGDLYLAFGEKAYGVLLTKDAPERKLYKIAVLGCGFGMGEIVLGRTMARAGLAVPDAEVARVHAGWRQAHARIVASWKMDGRHGLPALTGLGPAAEINKCRYEKRFLWLPDGTRLVYDMRYGPREIKGKTEMTWTRESRKGWRRVTGPLMTENRVQATARCVLRDAYRAVHAETGLWPVLTTHDDGTWIVPEADAQAFGEALRRAFSRPPDWAPGLPVRTEVEIRSDYGTIASTLVQKDGVLSWK